MSTPEQQNRNALDLLRMVAPERGAELENLVRKYTPSFLEATDQPRFVMQASLFGFVQYSNRTLLQVWLFGWVMWREMYCWSTFLWLLANKNQPFLLSDFEAIPGQTESYIDADSVHSEAMVFARSDPMDWTRWPSSVPKPLDIALGTKEDWLIKELIQQAIAFFLLHEFRHLILHSDGYTFTSRVKEEFECDHWAAEYLLGASDAYAKSSGEDPIKVKSKRAMGIALGTAVIAHIQELGLWDLGGRASANHGQNGAAGECN